MNCVLSSGERLELPNCNYTFRSSRLCPLVSFRGTKFAAILATLAHRVYVILLVHGFDDRRRVAA